MRKDVAAGKDVDVPIKYVSGAIDSPRVDHIFGGLYLADGVIRLRKGDVTFIPTVGATSFSIAPNQLVAVDNEPGQSARLHLRVPISDKKGTAKPRDFYFFNHGASTAGDTAGVVGGGGASVTCEACDRSIDDLYALLDDAQRAQREQVASTTTGSTGSGLVVEAPTKDFGTVSKLHELKWTFELRNTGTSDIEILAAKPGCGCMQTTFTKVIKAGGRGSVTAVVNISSFNGPITKVVDVITADPRVGSHLMIKAIVMP
jgi:hypothetical protein